MGSAFDGFEPNADDPFIAEHRLLSACLESFRGDGGVDFEELQPNKSAAGKDVMKQKGPAAVRTCVACTRRIRAQSDTWISDHLLYAVLNGLIRKKLPFDAESLRELLRWAAKDPRNPTSSPPLNGLVKACESYAENHDAQDLCPPLEAFHAFLEKKGVSSKTARKLAERLPPLMGAAPTLPILPGEAWSDRALSDIEGLPSHERVAWTTFLSHCLGATSGKPTKGWLKEASQHVDAIGRDAVAQTLRRWLPLLDAPRTQPIETWSEWAPNPNLMIQDGHADLLRGLIWCTPLLGVADLASYLADAAVSAYRKVPGIGPRAVKLGNACVYALGALESDEALAALAVLKVRVKFGTAQKGIEKALNLVAERTGIDRAELEELGVPAFGLDEVGLARESIGDFVAELRVVDRGKTQLSWIKPDGKVQKSVPKAVKDNDKDELKALKQAAKNIERMLIGQRERLDGLFLQQKQWTFTTFDQRYLSHPLVGTIARRLIWNIAEPGSPAIAAMWADGALRTRDTEVLTPTSEAVVTPWHPIDTSIDEVLAWRERLDSCQVAQPFKQAHREVYLLTDAERMTRTYSNRFAAHALKQHQFNALCSARGWKNTLRLMVDDEYAPPTKHLPDWGLRAEFWVEGLGDDYEADVNEAGTYLYLGTDQVRFYRTDAATNVAHAGGGGYVSEGTDRAENHPVPLEDVPPLVLSEVLRDVDLFVGVASVGNDPNWFDGGPDGRFRDYWHSYGFGELSGSAQTRKEALERLIPRLKIRDVCSFQDRFLVVRGKLRTYKIHLGSSNILMEPNDQYLCIVPAQSRTKKDDVFLPFEGDQRLSVVLSKAMLLAADDKIKDPTILSQLRI